MVVFVGIGLMLSALVVQGAAAALGVEVIDALLARRAIGRGVWSNGLATLLALDDVLV